MNVYAISYICIYIYILYVCINLCISIHVLGDAGFLPSSVIQDPRRNPLDAGSGHGLPPARLARRLAAPRRLAGTPRGGFAVGGPKGHSSRRIPPWYVYRAYDICIHVYMVYDIW